MNKTYFTLDPDEFAEMEQRQQDQDSQLAAALAERDRAQAEAGMLWDALVRIVDICVGPKTGAEAWEAVVTTAEAALRAARKGGLT